MIPIERPNKKSKAHFACNFVFLFFAIVAMAVANLPRDLVVLAQNHASWAQLADYQCYNSQRMHDLLVIVYI